MVGKGGEWGYILADDDVCHSLDQCTTPPRRSWWNGFTSAEGIILVVSEDMPQSECTADIAAQPRGVTPSAAQDQNGCSFRKINERIALRMNGR